MNSLFKIFDGKFFISFGNGRGITFYAMCILLGIVLGYILGVKEAKKLGISPNIITDGIIFCVPLTIVGARLYYVMFFENAAGVNTYFSGTFSENFVAIISVWNGGLAIMGAVIVTVIYAIVYCRIRKVSLYKIFDLIAPGLLIGQIMGRWGNWFNGEAHGGLIKTEGISKFLNNVFPWIMKKMDVNYCDFGTLTPSGSYYHPTFLYEGLWNLVGLIYMLVMRRKDKKLQVGDFLPFYMFWYGLGRALLIEPFRTDQLKPILGVPVNILVPAVMSLAGLVWFILRRFVPKFRDKQELYLEVLNDVKEHKVDAVVSRVEGVLIDINDVVKDAYKTVLKENNKQTDDREIAKYVRQRPSDVLNTEEQMKRFEEIVVSNIENGHKVLKPKAFYHDLYVKNYGIALYSKYSEAIVEACLEKVGIRRFANLYFENQDNPNNAINALSNYKNIFIISNNKKDLEFVHKTNERAKTCLTETENQAMEDYIDYVVSNYEDVNNIILI